ncbi:hypothetical protein C0Q70_05693 [Pomacea canaliculata]|uniref:Uncharacterized protein n=1 Tax=Pomacea canaliculata TaxID=400727 RepID=A0A2T7PLX4_POMCA|nr:hypothetical protein C0Q70_05693 [Pomacea canaliculata]
MTCGDGNYPARSSVPWWHLGESHNGKEGAGDREYKEYLRPCLKESARGSERAGVRERDSKGYSGGKVRGAAIRGTDEAHCPLRQRRPSFKGGQKCAVHLAATQTCCLGTELIDFEDFQLPSPNMNS